jgi:hypothetical protein
MAEKAEKRTLKERLPDFLGLFGSAIVLLVAYLIFNNKIPRNFWSYFSYFYVLAS